MLKRRWKESEKGCAGKKTHPHRAERTLPCALENQTDAVGSGIP
jgi:hypothetical protein